MDLVNTIDKSKVKKKQKINGTTSNDNIFGGKNVDTIYANGGSDMILAGKGNDKIHLEQNNFATVIVGKGDGNDTIYLNPLGDSGIVPLNPGLGGLIPSGQTLYLVLNKNPELSYSKNGNDLIITATYDKEGKEKKNTVQNITLKDYYRQSVGPFVTTNASVNILNSNLDSFSGKTIEEIQASVPLSGSIPLSQILQMSETIIKGKTNKNNNIIGSMGNDVIYGGNKTDLISEYAGNNTVYTGKKGTTIVASTSFLSNENGEWDYEDGNPYTPVSGGNDKYIVSSVKNKTFIMDRGGDDTLQINGAKADDIYMYFDMTRDGEILGTPMKVNGEIEDSEGALMHSLYFMNGNELKTAIKNNTVYLPIEQTFNEKSSSFSDIKITTKVSGVAIGDYFSTITRDISSWTEAQKANYGIDSDVNSITVGTGDIENIYFADAKGNNAQLISSNGIERAISALSTNVQNYLNVAGHYSTQSLFDSAKSILSIKTTKKMSKAEKASIAESKKMAKTWIDDLTKIYKSSKLGTDGDDVYSNIKKDTYTTYTYNEETGSLQKGTQDIVKTIASGKGNDTFKFSKDFGMVDIYAESRMVGINATETDKLIFTDYAFENGTLDMVTSSMGLGSPSLIVNAYKNPEDLYSPYSENSLRYNGFFAPSIPVQTKNLVIQDKFRSYDVRALLPIMGPSLSVDLSGNNKNNFIFAYGNAQINLGKGYNIIQAMPGSSSVQHEFTYNGGHDQYQMFNGSDDAYIVNLDKNTSLGIFDYGGTDFVELNANAMDMRIFFNMDMTSNVPQIIGDLKILDRSVLTAANVQKAGYNAVGVNIADYFDSEAGGKIENFSFIDKMSGLSTSFYMDEWIDAVASDVASWLGEKAYSSTEAVFEKNNKADINALIAIYKGTDASVCLEI
ncbi:hypothetical protein IJ182_00525 [bacterium]|nr:hypothetical protein [bacterium]